MRYVSRWGGYAVQVRPERTEPLATGEIRVLQSPVYARFKPEGLQPLERELALARWSFNGLYQEQDEVTIVPPDYRIGVFDSVQAQLDEGWSELEREEVERTLLDLSERFDDCIAIPRTMVPPPWPRYDDFQGTTETLMERLVEDGHSLEAVLTYERATQNRVAVVEALEALIADPDALLELQPEPDAEEILG